MRRRRLGHEDPASVQSYLDNTSRMKRADSIFYVPSRDAALPAEARAT